MFKLPPEHPIYLRHKWFKTLYPLVVINIIWVVIYMIPLGYIGIPIAALLCLYAWRSNSILFGKPKIRVDFLNSVTPLIVLPSIWYFMSSTGDPWYAAILFLGYFYYATFDIWKS